MTGGTYIARRNELERYFDRTAIDAWKRLTSDAPVGRIRATVRAGRDAMRVMILSWLPDDLRGVRILDAGCGTGALAIELARRGARVVGVDVSPNLVDLARQRARTVSGAGEATFAVGDMLDPQLGRFDFVVAMDSLIHYGGADIARILAELAARTRSAIVFTVAPRTPGLSLMHAVGRLFPRGDRAPAIAPISRSALDRHFTRHPELSGWRIARADRIHTGFYISQALEARRS